MSAPAALAALCSLPGGCELDGAVASFLAETLRSLSADPERNAEEAAHALAAFLDPPPSRADCARLLADEAARGGEEEKRGGSG